MNEAKQRWLTAFCWLGFLITFGAGLSLFLAPGFMSGRIGIPVPAGAEFNPYFIRLLGLVLVAIGLCYLMAIYDEDALRSLIFIGSGEKILAVLYSLAAFILGKVSALIWGVIIVDGILAILGIYIVISLSRTLWTEDDMEEK